MPKNIDGLKKSFLLMIDRIEKGGKLVTPPSAAAGTPATVPTNSTPATSGKSGRS